MPIFETLEDLAGAGIAAGPLIGLDPGTKTIGVAASDPSRLMAMPVETVRKTKFTADAERLLDLTAERKAAAIVLGLPRNMDGSEGPRAQSVRAFARNLSQKTDLPIVYWDERLSTVAAERELIAADASRAKRAQVIDQMAAVFILQGALDRLRNL
ncbi:MAG: Holliday junction resolvase RuvX [Rhodobiaceae bacterium]|nr:Holliday junction resolvase RuvX [Rhodobiaceae bacterium]MCC0013341.1 Holliday junction resolvase RuvX [Rhodobiaceae bacterium]MCC0051331.1 Holliday junction resolvase RuvX [Rhodobiaceae bacterium]MCC0061543.1 Holliday junction resolvase RuvX [Rhodobiaceae bacterium]